MKDPLQELTSGDDERAERAIPTIVELGSAALPALRELTRSENADTRWWAIRALAAAPQTQTSDLLLHLSDSNAEVRAAGRVNPVGCLLSLKQAPCGTTPARLRLRFSSW